MHLKLNVDIHAAIALEGDFTLLRQTWFATYNLRITTYFKDAVSQV
ncbi:hypothetical protein [Chamaesiphon sp. GL140_3_metabinner_50]|nr:hypothetical protein [Chamaesiphon sp. GL140_3_metabinner_50]